MTEAYTTGLADARTTVEREHHLQLDLLEAFETAVAAGSDPSEAEEILDRLVDYTKMHFASEQLLMRLYAYQEFEAHTLQHEETMERIERLRQAWQLGARPLTADTLHALRDWLVTHIGDADRALGLYLNQLESRRPPP